MSGASEITTTACPSTLTDPEAALTCRRRKELEMFRYSTIHVFP